MTEIDVFSGFLGAGKTTLIKKMIQEAYAGEKLVLIENEFGDIGIDGGFLQEAGIQITEMNSGCICCSLVGDFGRALNKVITEYAPERILIEPSGVGKLSDVLTAVQRVASANVQIGTATTVVDATSCAMYLENFGEFYVNQLETAACIILSRTDEMSEDEVRDVVSLIREHNSAATLVTTPWNQLSGQQILEAMEQRETLEQQMAALAEQLHDHDDDHHHDEHCHHGEHDHHHDDHCHHHDHDHEGCAHQHEHKEHCHDHAHEGHDHEHEHCHHDHHGHHHADEVFASWGRETTKKFDADALKAMLQDLKDQEKYGFVLRAKGIVEGTDGNWIHFDFVPSGVDVRTGCAGVIGRLCVIGSKLREDALETLFAV